jgi:AraC-like DNA-binding protein
MKRPPSLLTRYPCFETRDPDECAAALSQQWRHMKIAAGSATNYYARLNTASLGLVEMVAASLSPQQIRIEADDRFYFLTLPRVGGGDYTTNGRTFSVGLGEGLLELPGESEQHIRYSTDVELAVCSIPSKTFEREAEQLIGHPPPSPLEVFGTIPRDSPLRRKINLALDELDRPNGLFTESPVAALRFQHMLIAAIIEDTPNSWASLIQKEERTHNTPPWHRRRYKQAEEYMHAHLSDDISIGDVAGAVDIGTRQLTKSFRYCGTSPKAVLIDKRLEASMWDLTHPDPDTTVESIALKYWIPPSLYPKYFRKKYGVYPSEVLRKARRSL